MNSKMYDATSEPAVYTDYRDIYSNSGVIRHGSGVVEILRKCLQSNSTIFMANITVNEKGDIFAEHVIEALKEFKLLKVQVINCSFGGHWNNK